MLINKVLPKIPRFEKSSVPSSSHQFSTKTLTLKSSNLCIAWLLSRTFTAGLVLLSAIPKLSSYWNVVLNPSPNAFPKTINVHTINVINSIPCMQSATTLLIPPTYH